MLHNTVGVGGVKFLGKKHYGGARFNVICVMIGWVGVNFLEKTRYVTLEWPLKESKYAPMLTLRVGSYSQLNWFFTYRLNMLLFPTSGSPTKAHIFTFSTCFYF